MIINRVIYRKTVKHIKINLSEDSKKELNKHFRIFLPAAVKVAAFGVYTTIMKIPAVSEYPTITKTITGALISYIAYWLIIRVKAYYSCKKEIENGYI